MRAGKVRYEQNRVKVLGLTTRKHGESGSGVHKADERGERGGVGSVGASNDSTVDIDIVVVGSVDGRL